MFSNMWEYRNPGPEINQIDLISEAKQILMLAQKIRLNGTVLMSTQSMFKLVQRN